MSEGQRKARAAQRWLSLAGGIAIFGPAIVPAGYGSELVGAGIGCWIGVLVIDAMRHLSSDNMPSR